MVKRRFFQLVPIIILGFARLAGCARTDGLQGTEMIAVSRENLRVGVSAEYIIVPGTRSYAVLVSAPPGSESVMEVRLFDNGKDLSPFLRTDARVSGESVYSLISEPMPSESTPQLRPRLNWWGDLFRGFHSAYGQPLKRSVQVVVARKIVQGARSKMAADCPSWLFGDREDLYVITEDNEGKRTLDRVQVLAGVNNQSQVDALLNGICLSPDFENANGLKAYERAGLVMSAGKKHQLKWSRLQTICTF